MFPLRPNALLEVRDDAAGRPIALLSGLEGMARAMTVTVMPLVAISAFDDKAAVSNAYLVGSLVALTATLNVGWLEQHMARRWVVTLAMSGFVVANAVAAVSDGPVLALAIGLIASEAALFSVCLSMFTMEYIGRDEIRIAEARRMVFNGAGWSLGPLTAILLYTEVDERLPFVAAAIVGLVVLGYFWVLRLGSNPVLVTPRQKAPSALENIPRYFRQRYLRVAYAITLTRGTFWAGFFIYAPLYVLEAGLPAWTAGGIVTATAILLFASPFTLWLADRTSTRTVIVGGFVILAAALSVLGVIGRASRLGVVFWIAAAYGATWLDVLGNVPFMRTVKPRERLAMTTVFSSWRETSSFAAPALGAIVLLVGPFWLYFFALAVGCAATAALASTLPRRL